MITDTTARTRGKLKSNLPSRRQPLSRFIHQAIRLAKRTPALAAALVVSATAMILVPANAAADWDANPKSGSGSGSGPESIPKSAPALAPASNPNPNPNPKAQFIPIDPSQVAFQFESQDGEVLYPCRHAIGHPVLQDWKVICADPARQSATAREFRVHLRVGAYARKTNPKMRYQVMYFVTDPARQPAAPGRSQGTYTIFDLKDQAELQRLEMSQEIENVNFLTLTLTLNPTQASN